MIAEIYGKISSNGSNLSDQLEDKLTGDVFGALRYIDFKHGLFPLIGKAYFLSDSNEKKFLYLDSDSPNMKKIHFWPWIIEAEPDILIELIDNNKLTVIQIEVKYKSGLSSDDEVSQGINRSNNQLIRQMRALNDLFPHHRKIQIYLTADILYPIDLMPRVRRQADIEGLKNIELYWLSWHDFPSVLKENIKYCSRREKVVIKDILMLLHRKKFERFNQMVRPNVNIHIPLFNINAIQAINSQNFVLSMKNCDVGHHNIEQYVNTMEEEIA